MPVLVLAGSDDALIPIEESCAIAADLPNSEMVVIPEAGHLAPLENPAPSNAAILRFLRSLA
jgi:3-oxoadipate enol-lactonase